MPVKNTETSPSYAAAAAASGKSSPVAGSKGTTPADKNNTSPNGNMPAASERVSPARELNSKSSNKVNGIALSVPENAASTNGTIASPKDGGDNLLTPSSQDTQFGSQQETEKSAGTRTADMPKEKLIPAPPPPVNIWHLRQEEFNSKSKLRSQPVVSAPSPAVSKPSSSKPAEKQGEQKQVDRKNGSFKSDTTNWDKPKEASQYERKEVGRDRRKSADSSRVNGSINREDGTVRHSKASRHTNRTQNATAKEPIPELPPPIADTTSWPTPENAHDEERKERKEKEEKEKEKEKPVVARTSGPMKYVPAPFTPTIVHSAPLPTKGGRGGRGGRGGSSRGGATTAAGEPRGERSERAERPYTSNSATASLETEQRGRINTRGSGYIGRGSYHNRGGRRAGSAGSSRALDQRRGVSPALSSGKRRDSEQLISNTITEKANDNDDNVGKTTAAINETSPTTDNTGKDSRGNLPVEQVAEKQFERNRKTHHGQNTVVDSHFGHGHSKPDAINHNPESGTFYSSSGRSERGAMGGRSGFRGGRNSHMNSQYHNHHGSHSNPTSHGHQHFAQHHSQQPAYHSQPQPYRGYNRGNLRGHMNPGRSYQAPYQPAIYPPHQYAIPPYSYYEYIGIPAPGETPVQPDYYGELLATLTKQLEYYFSIDNLCKDIYLRRHMDDKGFVKMQLIASFGRIRNLTTDLDILRDACRASPHIEIVSNADGVRLRKATGWEAFVLSPEERDPSVRNSENASSSVADEEQNKEASKPNEAATKSVPEMSPAAPVFEPQIRQQPSLSSVAPVFVPAATVEAPEFINGESSLQSSQGNGTIYSSSKLQPHLPATALVFSSAVINGLSNVEDFPDSKVVEVIIVYKKSLLDSSTINATFPNGDLSSIDDGDDDGAESPQSSPYLGPSSLHQSRLSHHGVSWIIGQQLDHAPLRREVHEPYTTLRANALQTRFEGAPMSAKMVILYRFWRHFLRNHFNRKMYDEFMSLATQDSKATGGKSIDFLFEFYETLHFNGSPAEGLTRDFINLVEQSFKEGYGGGLAKLSYVMQSAQSKPAIRARFDSLIRDDLKSQLTAASA